MKKCLILLLVVFLLCGVFDIAFGKTVWQADLSKDGPFKWHAVYINKQDRFEIKNNELIMTGVAAPYLGSRYRVELPDIDSGALCFDVWANSAGASGAVYTKNGFSLQVRLADAVTAFGAGSWYRYRKDAQKKQVRMYKDPPSGGYFSCKIAFDKNAGTLKYYLNDMNVPVYIEDNVKFSEKMILIIGNYGLCGGTVENRLRNIRLEKSDESEQKSAKIFVMHGFDSGSYMLDRLIESAGNVPVARFYVKPFVNVLCSNVLTIDRMPDFADLGPGSMVIMADMPLNCAKLTELSLRELESAVKNGTALVVLGGMFTLNKGCFAGTPLEKMMPVKIEDPFAMHVFPEMAEFPGVAGSAFYMAHKGEVKPSAEVFSKYRNVPLLVGWKYGRGKVIVSMPVPAGDMPAGRIYCGRTRGFTDKIIKSIKSLK